MVVTKVNVVSEFCPECEEIVEKIQLEGIATCEFEKFDAHELIGETLDVCSCCEQESEPELKEPEFGGSYIINGEEVYIKEMIYDKPNVIALWSDGTKTRCTCHKEDKWNPEMALLMCVMKKVTCSTEHLGKLLEDWAVTEDIKDKRITLRDIRKKYKVEKEKYDNDDNDADEIKSLADAEKLEKSLEKLAESFKKSKKEM